MDLNDDGFDDLISGGNSPGNVYLFKGSPTGFKARESIPEDEAGLMLTSPAYFVDWDGDGDLDMFLGCKEGGVYYNANLGDKKQFKFGKREPVLVNGKPIELGIKTRVISVDWDSDGILDLVVAGDLAVDGDPGHVMFYRGRKDRSLADGVPLIPGKAQPIVGYRPWPHFVDWNKDGALDVLFGSVEAIEGGGIKGYVYLFLRKK